MAIGSQVRVRSADLRDGSAGWIVLCQVDHVDGLVENWALSLTSVIRRVAASAGGRGRLAPVCGCDGDIVLRDLLPVQGAICHKKLVVIIGGRFRLERNFSFMRHHSLPISQIFIMCLNRAITVPGSAFSDL